MSRFFRARLLALILVATSAVSACTQPVAPPPDSIAHHGAYVVLRTDELNGAGWIYDVGDDGTLLSTTKTTLPGVTNHAWTKEGVRFSSEDSVLVGGIGRDGRLAATETKAVYDAMTQLPSGNIVVATDQGFASDGSYSSEIRILDTAFATVKSAPIDTAVASLTTMGDRLLVTGADGSNHAQVTVLELPSLKVLARWKHPELFEVGACVPATAAHHVTCIAHDRRGWQEATLLTDIDLRTHTRSTVADLAEGFATLHTVDGKTVAVSASALYRLDGRSLTKPGSLGAGLPGPAQAATRMDHILDVFVASSDRSGGAPGVERLGEIVRVDA